MSRIGKKPVLIPDKVSVRANGEIVVKGPKGELRQRLVPGVRVTVNEAKKQVEVTRASDSKDLRAQHGLIRALIQNMIQGVTAGYEKRLRIMGTGYRVELQGKALVIHAGYCAPVQFPVPAGIEIEVPKAASREFMDFYVRGIDKYLVGETAARIRRIRPPDLYKGKGIRYYDEHVRRLEGKTFTTAG